MSKITIIEGNSNEKDNTRAYMVKGEKGEKGDANTLSIGTVEETETAQATITGDAPNQTLNLGLPKADTNSLSIGTVTKGADASATITGDAPNQTLNLVLPKGDTGSQGPAGFEVPQGAIIGFDTEIEIPEGYTEINGFENYSNTETKIGTWINGKPLYRIVLTGTKVSGSNLEINLPANSVCVHYSGILISSNNYKYPLNYYENSNIYHNTIITNNNALKVFGSTGIYDNGDIIAVILYTKITD